MSLDPAKAATFINAWLNHGNVRRAMREAGIGSPTTAYRLLASYQKSPGAWSPPIAKPTRAVPSELAEEIRQLREKHPSWGKAKIAEHLEAVHGRKMVSAAGVRAVLAQANLWSGTVLNASEPHAHRFALRPTSTARFRSANKTAHDVLGSEDLALHRIRGGIQRDLRGDYIGAISLLDDQLWTPLVTQARLLEPLLRKPELGSWLIRSLIYLAHSLIDAGRWGSARRYLDLAMQWMESPEGALSTHQSEYQNRGLWVTSGIDAPWEVVSLDSPPPPPDEGDIISLRQDDIWLEGKQYLGVVLRDARGVQGLESLACAKDALGSRHQRRILPSRRSHFRGVIEHDIAALELRKGYPAWSILQRLDQAEGILRHESNRGMLATAYLTRARTLHRDAMQAKGRGERAWIMRMDEALEAIESSFAALDREPSVMLRVNTGIGATKLRLEMRCAAEVDDLLRIREIAKLCIGHGFRDKAAELLAMPEAVELPSSDREALQALVGDERA